MNTAYRTFGSGIRTKTDISNPRQLAIVRGRIDGRRRRLKSDLLSVNKINMNTKNVTKKTKRKCSALN